MTDTREVFERHLAALAARDLDAIVADYASDAVLGDNGRMGQGHAHIRAVFAETLDQVMAVEPVTEVHELGTVVFVTWRADPPGGSVVVGADTFVIEDGEITAHTGFHSP